MTLADLAIRRPVFAWMLMSGIVLFGWISFLRLGVSYLPDTDYPTLTININWPGAASEVMESELVDPMEERVVAVEGVEEMRSTISEGNAKITLEFDLNRNIDSAVQEVAAYLQQFRLPLGVQPPTIQKVNPEDDPIMRVAIYGNYPLRDLADYTDKHLQTALQVVPGVGDVHVYGFGQRNLRIWLDNNKLKFYELTVLDVANAVQAQHEETAAGYVEDDQHRVNIRTLGEGITPAQMGDILILNRGGAAIYNSQIHIRDVARVEDGLSDTTYLVAVNSQPALSIDIKKQRGFNEVEVADRVSQKLEELKRNLPKGMKAETIVDYTRFTKQAVDETERELIIAGLLTSVICFFFLGTWSSSLNVLIAIPISIIGTFTVLYALHFTLNLFTLLALALAIGIVVDDAIMVLENIVRHFEMGKSRRQAALIGAREITPAAVAATIAVVAIFFPVTFMKGVIGRFFYQFGITMSVAVLFSLLEAITLTPMRCSRLLTAADDEFLLVRMADRSFRTLTSFYRKALIWSLDHCKFILVCAGLLFGLSLFSLSFLREEFVPPQDQNFFHINMDAPVGSSIPFTCARMKIVEDYIKTFPEVKSYLSTSSDYHSSCDVVLVDKSQRHRTQAELIDLFRRDLRTLPELQDMKFWFSDLSARGLSGRAPNPVAFNLQGAEYGILTDLADKIVKKLEATGLVNDLNTNFRYGMPEADIIPDREAAAVRDVSIDDIEQTVNASIGGVDQGKFTSGGHRYDVRIMLDSEYRADPDDIKSLQVRTGYGELIPISDVTTMQRRTSLLSIARINRERTVSISGNLAPGVSQNSALAQVEKIARASLPPGYEFHLEGSAQTFQDSFNSIWFAILLGAVVAYMVLASQFNSFLHPVTVLLALPFSLTGALLALWLTNQSINLFSMIGIVLLMGIAKKNSILLVEFANQVRATGKYSVRGSLIEACPIRLRPILMTSVATIAAAIPPALGLGSGSETRVPMAIAVIGGMIVSTVFILFVVPCAYSLLAPWEKMDEEELEVGEDQPAGLIKEPI